MSDEKPKQLRLDFDRVGGEKPTPTERYVERLENKRVFQERLKVACTLQHERDLVRYEHAVKELKNTRARDEYVTLGDLRYTRVDLLALVNRCKNYESDIAAIDERIREIDKDLQDAKDFLQSVWVTGESEKPE